MNRVIEEAKDFLTISSSRLKVTIARPGTYYKGARFDWTGFITGIELDGVHSYCVPESLVPGIGTGGSGICNEFGINDALGYDEAGPGEKFPKLGIGLLTKKDNSPYHFTETYPIEPFPVSVSSSGDQVEFIAEPVKCGGYSARLTKIIYVYGNRMKIDYKLENTGRKRIHTEEYCHNFMGIDGHPAGPEYLLKMSFNIELENIPEAEMLITNGNTITWKGIPEKDFYNCPKGFLAGEPHVWELIYKPDGTGVKEFSNFPVSRIALWGTTHVISPEVFIDIDIAPGEACQWMREYEFFSGK